MRSPFKKSHGRTLTAAMVVCTAGVAMAASGVSSFAATGDGSTATAHQAQVPLGNMSATPPAPTSDNSPSANTLSPAPNSPSGGSLGESESSPNNQSGNQPAGAEEVSVSAGSGGNGSSLPFTGFLAIPVLLIGVALLGSGMAVRRRTAQAQAA
jgi:hypothetical protein